MGMRGWPNQIGKSEAWRGAGIPTARAYFIARDPHTIKCCPILHLAQHPASSPGSRFHPHLNMESLFEQLLPELASLIGDYLDLASLRSLRLVSKSCETKFSHAFSRSLEIQNIDLTEAGLKRLNDLASSSGLKPGVRTLRLTCLHHRRHRADEEINARLERTQPADAYPIPIMDLPSPEEMAHYELWAKDKHDVEAFADGSSMCKLLSHVLSNFESLDEISLERSYLLGPRSGTYQARGSVYSRLAEALGSSYPGLPHCHVRHRPLANQPG